MNCRTGCGACCVAPSISSVIPEMPLGKPAGVSCIQLGNDFTCAIFGSTTRPKVCASLQPMLEMCGKNKVEALAYLAMLEKATVPE